jgi:serine/threonine-protein kinase HipA
LVGALRLDQHGDLGFTYDQAWIDDQARPPISQSLPKRAEPFKRRETRPFFAGLLPEAFQRETVAQNLGISKANDFRLLEALGGDVAGALTLWPEGETPPEAQGLTEAHPLDDAELIEILDILPKRPMLAGREGLRLAASAWSADHTHSQAADRAYSRDDRERSFCDALGRGCWAQGRTRRTASPR